MPAATDHPRVSGEHSLLFSVAASVLGSSPRERGARPRAPHARLSDRIIPA